MSALPEPAPVHLIKMHELTRMYDLGPQTIRALNGVDLEIDQGEYDAIMGPSGSGKSTLMNIIGCLDPPSAGSYILDGVPVESMNDDELADEPTGNLDSQTGREILDLFHELHSRGNSIILVTHEDDVAREAARVIRLRDGKIVA